MPAPGSRCRNGALQWQGKSEAFGKTPSHCHRVHKSHMGTALGWNPGLRLEKPATNRPSYDAVCRRSLLLGNKHVALTREYKSAPGRACAIQSCCRRFVSQPTIITLCFLGCSFLSLFQVDALQKCSRARVWICFLFFHNLIHIAALVLLGMCRLYTTLKWVDPSGKLLLTRASAVILGSESRGTHCHILLFHDSGTDWLWLSSSCYLGLPVVCKL